MYVKVSEDRVIDFSKYYGFYIGDVRYQSESQSLYSIFLQRSDIKSHRDTYLADLLTNDMDVSIQVFNELNQCIASGDAFVDVSLIVNNGGNE